MAETKYAVFDLQFMDRATGKAIISSGGKALVVANGLTSKSTLVNPDSSYASLTNAISATRGKFRFAVAASPDAAVVDLYGYAPGGQWFVATSVKPGDPTEIWIDTYRRAQLAVIPVLASDYTAASENDTGLDLPTGAIVMPGGFVKTTVAQSAKTIDVGLLSSESGGDADGFMAAMSIGTAATVISKLASTATVGALLHETANAVEVPIGKVIAAAVSISITPSSGSTTGACIINLPYMMPAS